MRRYLQGTLDFACGIYAVINALSCLRGLDLAGARRVFQETQISLASRPGLWARFSRNETDHYWLVRYMLQRWCLEPPYRLHFFQPFSDCLLPGPQALDLDRASMFLPEARQPDGPPSFEKTRSEAEASWKEVCSWFLDEREEKSRKAAILRFHRFIPGVVQPVVSHWTTVRAANTDCLYLHDASAEQGALYTLEHKVLLPDQQRRAPVRIVPESILLLQG